MVNRPPPMTELVLAKKPCAKEGCVKFGQIHDRCTGHLSANNLIGTDLYGQPCRKYPARGLTVCPTHGGGHPAAKLAGQRNVAKAQALHRMQMLGIQRTNLSPADALLEEVRWTAGHVEWLRQKVGALDDGGMTWTVQSEVRKNATEFPGTDTTTAAAPNVWYELYARERAHLVKACAAAVAANVEERRVQLAVDQGQLVAGLLRRVLTAAFELIVGTLRTAGVSDAAIIDALSASWQEFLATTVPAQLRAAGTLDAAQ